MPKNPSIRILERWMDLDWELAWKSFGSRGMVIAEFAEKWGVDEKTIRRDLRMFRDLGFDTRGGFNYDDDGTFQWSYRNVSEPVMFTGNALRLRQLVWD